MLFDEKLDAEVRTLIDQWNIAEERIKRAENIRDGEVVASAIFELRYAGRKIIDALKIAIEHDLLQDGPRKSVTTALAEAGECCIKAKHDAIDSVLTFLTIYFKRIQKRFRISTIHKYFPEYLKNMASIRGIQRKIEASRRDRAENREAIYDEIAQNEYAEVLQLFGSISASADLIAAEARWEKMKKIAQIIFNTIMFTFGVAGLAAVVRHW